MTAEPQTYDYRLFGLNIRSDLELPELHETAAIQAR